MSLQTILDEVRIERERQEGLWGADFDAKNDLDNWVTFISTYCGLAAIQTSPEGQRRRMLQVATLAIAACEAFDHNDGFSPRHYDKGELA